MKLSQIYSNDNRFETIRFNEGFNVILASINNPFSKNKDTHNLGKSTLALLIDFCLLKKINKEYFLLKHREKFEKFIFFLEVFLGDNKYFTISRGVELPSKVSIVKHSEKWKNCKSLTQNDWDHCEVPIKSGKSILDGILDLKSIKEWSFRHPVGYSLRNQSDYRDVFQLDKFRGKHSEWKPVLSSILGLDGNLVKKKYSTDESIKELEQKASRLRAELTNLADTPDLLDGLIESKKEEISSIENSVKKYDFNIAEKEINKNLVDSLESKIAHLNNERYTINLSIKNIKKSLREKIVFDLNKITSIFKDVKIAFPTSIKKNFSELVEFNKSLFLERFKYLKEDLSEKSKELKKIEDELSDLNTQRSEALSELREIETFEKYKKLNNILVNKKADLETLERQKKTVTILREFNKKINDAKEEVKNIVEEMQVTLENPSLIYKQIKHNFREIIKKIIDQQGEVFTKVNNEGNYEFNAEILDDSRDPTSKDKGHTYRKFLCIAFDMALLKTYIKKKYIKFTYHDGVFESLDNRKKIELIDIMREYSKIGIQQIITSIESDLPLVKEGSEHFKFEENEIICNLNDSGENGRLFKMSEW